jgi:hypothetical protein
MVNKERYKILCQEKNTIPLYSQDWWLDCVCGEKQWDVILFETQGHIEAAMPFYIPYKGIITMPAFTQSLGIWLNPVFEDDDYSNNLYRKQQICVFFIKNLPKHKEFMQAFHYSFTDWLPFYWNKYQQYTRYNYILTNIKDKNLLWKNLNENIKRNINKAEKKHKLNIKRNIPINLFTELIIQTYKRQGEQPYQLSLMKKIIEMTQQRNQGDIWGAYDNKNHLYAAVFIVWHNDRAYYIAGGQKTEFSKSGSLSFARWKAINELPEQINTFDFAGSMAHGIERFFRSFGAVQIPYFVVFKGKLNLFQKIIIKLKYYVCDKKDI